MSRVTPSAPGSVDATPTPQQGKTDLRGDAPAVRLGIGRFTVDLVEVRGVEVLAVVGWGVGADTEPVTLPLGAVAVLLGLADTVDARTVWNTAAWPLAC